MGIWRALYRPAYEPIITSWLRLSLSLSKKQKKEKGKLLWKEERTAGKYWLIFHFLFLITFGLTDKRRKKNAQRLKEKEMKDKSCRGFLSILRLLHVSMSCGHSYERKLSAHIKAHANVSKDYISRNFSSKKTSFVLSFHVSSLPNKRSKGKGRKRLLVWKRHMKDRQNVFLWKRWIVFIKG